MERVAALCFAESRCTVQTDGHVYVKITPELPGEHYRNANPRRIPTVTGELHDSASGFCSFTSVSRTCAGFFIFKAI